MRDHKESRSLYPPSRILKSYIEALTRSSQVFNPHGLNNTLFPQNFVLETAASIGLVGGMYIPKTRDRGEETPIALGQLLVQPAVTSSQ